METQLIHHVSDTAAWVAMYRALESKREDAVFQDPFAERLAGEAGKKMVESMPHSETMEFALVIRTVAIDRLIQIAIGNGTGTVINVGAGLDTRPYRMTLPRHLRWIEIDFEDTIEYKNELLKSETPVCHLERRAADLSQRKERRILFSSLGAQTKKALVITEGLVWYLTNEEGKELSEDIFATPSFKYWIVDYAQGKMRRNKQSRDVSKNLKHAPWKFDVHDPIQFFGEQGWKVKENVYMLDEADRVGRKMPAAFPWSLLMRFPATRQLANKTYGYVMFEK
jgi:methyltransferase (TIGR00027 family)